MKNKSSNAAKPMGLLAATSLGMGAMIGAGIFALLGEAGAIAGSAVYISFAIGGVIALASGYSLGKLGARYPSAGGIVEYLIRGYGAGALTGTMSLVLYIAAIVSLSLVAKTFGNYGAALLGAQDTIAPTLLAVTVIVAFVLVNLRGAKDVAFWEQITVAAKFLVLTIFMVVGLTTLKPELLSPATYPPHSAILFSLAITFFAYEGFRVITNTAEDMPNPAKTLPKAIMLSIVLVALLYIGVSLAVFGNLSAAQVMDAKEYALAEAAKPVFGQVGFTVVAITALISTASAINANLYAVTNVTYRLAVEGVLPRIFEKPIAHSREGLVISGLLIIFSTLLLDLSAIAAIGSVSILLVHAICHLGHIRLRHETGARLVLILTALVLTAGAMGLSLFYLFQTRASTGLMIVGFLGFAFLSEMVLRRFSTNRLENS